MAITGVGPPTRPGRALIDGRRTRVLELKVQGWDDVQIGLALRAGSPEDPEREGWPGGYNPRASVETLANNVRQDIIRAMKIRRGVLDEKVAERTDLVERRIERLYEAMAPSAYAGDPRAARVCLGLIQETCKLRGLYAPLRVDATITDGERDEIEGAVDGLVTEIYQQLGRPDEDSPDAI